MGSEMCIRDRLESKQSKNCRSPHALCAEVVKRLVLTTSAPGGSWGSSGARENAVLLRFCLSTRNQSCSHAYMVAPSLRQPATRNHTDVAIGTIFALPITIKSPRAEPGGRPERQGARRGPGGPRGGGGGKRGGGGFCLKPHSKNPPPRGRGGGPSKTHPTPAPTRGARWTWNGQSENRTYCYVGVLIDAHRTE